MKLIKINKWSVQNRGKSTHYNCAVPYVSQLQCILKILTNGFQVSLKFPRFTTNLAISLHSCQSNCELRNKVANFLPNFVGSCKVSKVHVIW